MTVFPLRRIDSVSQACPAVVGVGTVWRRPSLPGARFCSFHAGLKGPWAKAIRSSHLT
jgi:hypothetical protein